MIDRPGKAMVVTPHPDDAEIGCGGTVAKWIKKGTEITYILCTNGDKGTSDPDITSKRLADIREKEQGEAARFLGVKEVVYLRYPDGNLEDTMEFRGRLVKAIRNYRPDIVFCPDPFRRSFYLHRDHRICGQVTLDAVFPYARDRLHYHEHIKEGLQPHKVRDILFCGTEEPDTFIDIADTIQLKIDALNKHYSQLSTENPNEAEEFIRSLARRVGHDSELLYGEAFRRIELGS